MQTSDGNARRVIENAALIGASPWLIGCSCCLVPVLFGVGLLVLSVVAGMSAEVIMFVMKNSKVIGIIALMIGIVGVGYVLYKKYEAPKPE